MTIEPNPEPTNLEVALGYARRGWRVIPVQPHGTFPAMKAWQLKATTDEATITRWWTTIGTEDREGPRGPYKVQVHGPAWGIGIATGRESGIWVFDVDTDRRRGKYGDESLAELEDAYGPLPDTYEVITGSGGRHLYFAWPDDPTIEIRNDQSGQIGPHLDVRADGGFVIAPPSVHKLYGTTYQVEASSAHEPVPAPGWLVALAQRPEPQPRQAPATSGPTGDRPGDLWAAATAWAQILEPDGWTLHHVDRDGEEHWTRPGKQTREGTSATTGYKGSDVLKVFTSSHPHLAADATYSKLGYLAATRHGGTDAAALSAAARQLAADGWRTKPMPAFDDLVGPTLRLAVDQAAPHPAQEPAAPDLGDWAPVDLTSILSGDHKPPAPTLLAVRNTLPLLYPARTNAIFGESGAGKTWVAMAAIAEVIRDGGTAALIDLEDNAHGATSRLRALGLTDDQLIEQFLYLCPQTAWGPVAQAAVAALVDRYEPELVVLDSTGEAMAAGGVKGNDDDDVARWFVTCPKFIARRGPAVVVIDHVPKDPNAPTKYMIGSQRKTAAIDGASYRVEAVKAPSKTSDGLLKIVVAKDRNGTRSQGDVAAMCSVAPDLVGGIVIDLHASDGPPLDPAGKPRLTVYMERVSRLLELDPGLSGRDIESRCDGKAKHIRDATTTLREEGWIEQNPAARGFSYVVVTPYREADDPVISGGISDGTASRVPTASHRVPTTPGSGAEVTASPALLSTRAGTRSRPDQPPEKPDNASQARPDATPQSPPVDNFAGDDDDGSLLA